MRRSRTTCDAIPPRRLCASEARHRDGGGSKALDGPESRINAAISAGSMPDEIATKTDETATHRHIRHPDRHPGERVRARPKLPDSQSSAPLSGLQLRADGIP